MADVCVNVTYDGIPFPICIPDWWFIAAPIIALILVGLSSMFAEKEEKADEEASSVIVEKA